MMTGIMEESATSADSPSFQVGVGAVLGLEFLGKHAAASRICGYVIQPGSPSPWTMPTNFKLSLGRVGDRS